MNLSGQQFGQLLDALVSAFPNIETLEVFVKRRMDENLNAIAGGSNLTAVVYKLIEWATARGRLAELVEAAYRDNSGDPKLRAFAEPYFGPPSDAGIGHTVSEKEKDFTDADAFARLSRPILLRDLDLEGLLEIARLFSDLPCVRTPARFPLFLRGLPPSIRGAYIPGGPMQANIETMVSTALDVDGDFDKMIYAAHLCDGSTNPFRKLVEAVQKYVR